MAIYIFKNPKTGEIREIVQSVNDEHIFIDENGLKWDREFTVPNASIDTKWDANSSKDFIEKTKNKKGTVGDLFDKSKELSEKREEKYGIDEVKEKFINDYSKSRGGREHPSKRKEKAKKAEKKLSKILKSLV